MNILICPGAAENQKFKRWPVEKFVKLVDIFIDLKFKITIILGPDEEYLSKYFSNKDVYISDSLTTLKRLSSESDLIICNDSFLLHFFSFLKKRVLVLYGPTDSKRTKPIDAFEISSKSISKTRPCYGKNYYGKCDGERCSCFDGLEVNDVFEKTMQILGK